MRWVNIGVIVALVAVILSSRFRTSRASRCPFSASGSARRSLVVALVLYLLGMATGGSVWALVRWAWQGRKETSAS